MLPYLSVTFTETQKVSGLLGITFSVLVFSPLAIEAPPTLQENLTPGVAQEAVIVMVLPKSEIDTCPGNP